jgi:hypothetical protein
LLSQSSGHDPIADAGDRHTPSGRIRNPWYDTTCCPPNLERTFASLPAYFYSTANDGLYVHLYDNSELRWKLDSGNPIKVTQTTRYPWERDVALRVSPAQPEEFTLYTRIPAWSRRTSVKVNGKAAGQPVAGEYLALRRTWTANDLVEISFDMQPQIVDANPAVADDTGRIAMQRGPIIFCMEQLDQAEQASEKFRSFPPGQTQIPLLDTKQVCWTESSLSNIPALSRRRPQRPRFTTQVR